jgi:hypothetical protein
MNDALGGPGTGAASTRWMISAYTRVVALLLLGAGLARAGLILGVNPGGENFSTIEPAWQAGAVTLILVDLFAAVGLWIGATWGPVMWAVALVVEISMYTIFADLFGSHVLRIAVHGLLFVGFLGLSILEWRRLAEE